MATKIRLSRHGKKGYAFYHIVVADSRAPRDGKFIEKLGTYNPNTHPATVELSFERAVYWLGVGAQPTDTTRSILSREGAMYRHHLNGGVRKGAFDQAAAEQKFAVWKAAKEKQHAELLAKLEADKNKTAKERLAHETKVKEAKSAALAAKLSQAAAQAVKVETSEDTAPAAETAEAEAAAEVTAAAPAAEEVAPAAEEVAPAAEEVAPVAEEKEAEAPAEAPAAEEVAAEE